MSKRRLGVLAAVAAILLAGAADAGAVAVDADPARFVPVAPQRVLDTRDTTSPVGPNGTITVNLSGQTPDTATAVVLNVTGTTPTAATFVTVYPSDQPRPVTSNLNLVRGQTKANAATIALSADRRVTLHNFAGNTHLVVDLVGYYATDQGAGFDAHLNPQRVLDTRFSAPVGPGGVVTVPLGLPSWDRPDAVVLNVTAVDATVNTFITAYEAGQPVPSTSSLNLGPGEAVPNQVTVPIGVGRTANLLNRFGNVHLVVDVVGYYRPGSGSEFVAITPTRRMDTRPDSGIRPDGPGISLDGWDPDVVAVAANLTGTNPTAAQHVVVWPGGSPRPGTSSLNLVPGQTAANAVTVGIGYEPMHEARTVNFVNNAGYVDLIFDVFGFFVPAE